jgi:hypothetical protein
MVGEQVLELFNREKIMINRRKKERIRDRVVFFLVYKSNKNRRVIRKR